MSLMFTPELQLYMFDYEWNGREFSHAVRANSLEEANELPAAMSKGKFVGEVDEYPSGEESTTAGVLLSAFQFEYEYEGETRFFTIPADDKEEAIGRAAALANFKELGAYARETSLDSNIEGMEGLEENVLPKGRVIRLGGTPLLLLEDARVASAPDNFDLGMDWVRFRGSSPHLVALPATLPSDDRLAKEQIIQTAIVRLNRQIEKASDAIAEPTDKAAYESDENGQAWLVYCALVNSVMALDWALNPHPTEPFSVSVNRDPYMEFTLRYSGVLDTEEG